MDGRHTQNGKASVHEWQTNRLVNICYAAPVSGAALANPGRVPSSIAHDTPFILVSVTIHHLSWFRFRSWQPPNGEHDKELIFPYRI